MCTNSSPNYLAPLPQLDSEPQDSEALVAMWRQSCSACTWKWRMSPVRSLMSWDIRGGGYHNNMQGGRTANFQTGPTPCSSTPSWHWSTNASTWRNPTCSRRPSQVLGAVMVDLFSSSLRRAGVTMSTWKALGSQPRWLFGLWSAAERAALLDEPPWALAGLLAWKAQALPWLGIRYLSSCNTTGPDPQTKARPSLDIERARAQRPNLLGLRLL